MANLMEYFAQAIRRKGAPEDSVAASLRNPFNNAATTATGEDMVQSAIAPFLNMEGPETRSENPVTENPARELPILVGGREPLYREQLADDAYAALRRGDENKLAGLLKATGDLRGETESPVALLLGAAERKGEKLNLSELVREADPNGQEDPRLVALVLCATGGNVQLADEILAAMDDDGDDDDPDSLPKGSGILLSLSRALKSSNRHIFNLSADPNTNADGTANTHGLSAFLHKCENFFSNLLHMHKSQLEDTTDPQSDAKGGGTDANAPATISDQQILSTTQRIFGAVFGNANNNGPTPPSPSGPKSRSGS
jgi:hypothetical protein